MASPVDLGSWFPPERLTLRDTGLPQSLVEELILKYLLNQGDSPGRGVADQIKLSFGIVEPLLRQMKDDQLVVYRGAAALNDYVYQLTDMGRERGRILRAQCTYYGAAPVPLRDYIDSVKQQSLETQKPTEDDLKRAFTDLLVNPRMLDRLGPAVNSGRGMFLFGNPGNGKTSVAERVTRAFGDAIWVPRAVEVEGAIMRLFDPMCHEAVQQAKSNELFADHKVDQRWIRIRRPTIVVGGELTMDRLEVTEIPSTGICEAPLQMKSNCGTLVIDDFGRQKMSTDELLNRWIVPLEKRYDFLNMPNGKKIQVPFDQLIVFSTNLEPRDLVDDAFLRRIPYKIEVPDPSEAEFRELFKIMVPKMGFEYRQGPIDYLIERHYKAVNRPFRCCQPRDLLLQVRNMCQYKKLTPELTQQYFDAAAENYFSVM